MILRTRSHSPMLTPPLVRIASWPERLSSVALSSSIESVVGSCLTAWQPIDSTSDARAWEFDSYIWPGANSDPGGTSSSPVDNIAIVGLLTTSTSPWPIDPANASVAEDSVAPAGSASCPLERFSALLRIYPVLAGPSIVTLVPSTLVSSTMTIASAPSGNGAPVIILHAWPGPISGGCSPPVWLTPTIVSVEGPSSQSEARTAKPSIAELSNRGSST